jgi:tetratricopeptide (TPR) repeat protein
MTDPGGDPLRRSLDLAARARGLIDDKDPDRAITLLEQAIALSPETAECWNQLGRALNNLRRLPEARRALERAVHLDKDVAEAWSNLGHVCRMLGEPGKAARAFRMAAELAPESPRALRDLASIHLEQGEPEEGVMLLRRAVEADPSDIVALTRLGDASLALDDLDTARSAYSQAIESDARAVGALIGLAALENRLGRYAPAEAGLRNALSIAPHDPAAVSILVEVMEIQGRAGEALDLLESTGWDHPPGWAVAARCRLLFGLGRGEEAGRLLEATDLASLDPQSRSGALKVLGALREQRGDYRSAFAAFEEANRGLPTRFDPAGFVRSVDRLIGFFSRENLARLPTSDCDSWRPVFIVGMPRSGTSLVEQILGSHPQVHPCGERTDIYRLPRELSAGSPGEKWPACLASTAPAVLAAAARDYLDNDGSEGTGATRITDKLPANFLNLGLVQLMFPNASVVYCRRDPMDTGLSCYQQDFRSPGMDFARDLSHIGLYQQGCRRLMAHWSSVLDIPVHSVDYETLIESPETVVRELLAFLDLPWEPQCLAFHASGRVVRTASHDQVRRPLYRSSVGRWRAFEPWLEPLEHALEAPWPAATG